MVRTEGDLLDEDNKPLVEENKLWMCDPVECIHKLVGNPTFEDHIAYDCQQVYIDVGGQTHIVDEIWTGDWW